MPLASPADNLLHAPTADVIVLLLRQFKRLLSERDIDLTTDDMEALAKAAADYQSLPGHGATIKIALEEMVTESLNVLREQFKLSFAEALATDMSAIGGWQTTAEFLDIANQKSNAELRVSAGSTLLVLFGEAEFAPLLLDVIVDDAGANDVDGVFARRALAHLARVPADAPDWLEKVKEGLRL